MKNKIFFLISILLLSVFSKAQVYADARAKIYLSNSSTISYANTQEAEEKPTIFVVGDSNVFYTADHIHADLVYLDTKTEVSANTAYIALEPQSEKEEVQHATTNAIYKESPFFPRNNPDSNTSAAPSISGSVAPVTFSNNKAKMALLPYRSINTIAFYRQRNNSFFIKSITAYTIAIEYCNRPPPIL